MVMENLWDTIYSVDSTFTKKTKTNTSASAIQKKQRPSSECDKNQRVANEHDLKGTSGYI